MYVRFTVDILYGQNYSILMTNTKNIEIIEVLTVHGSYRWIVQVGGRPVANYGTLRSAEKKAASL